MNGITMNVEVSGADDAPAVLLHHPLATNLSLWDELTAALAPTYRVVRFDARGHGRSEAPQGRYPFETLAGDVLALMDQLGITKARYLGLSMGGMVGQYLGFMAPERFHGLALVSTASAVPADARALWDDRIATARKVGMAPLVETSLARWVAPAKQGDEALLTRLKAMIETTPPEGYAGWCQSIAELNVTGKLAQITLPTCVIVGAEDPATPPAAAEVIHAQIAGSQLIVMPGVSHMLCAEEPEAFHGHVLAFFASLDPQS
ncbi:MAG: alpha/beta fold hydrolase [Pseudomonadota bacterium]